MATALHEQGYRDRRPQEQQTDAGPAWGKHGEEPLHQHEGALDPYRGVAYCRVDGGIPFGRSVDALRRGISKQGRWGRIEKLHPMFAQSEVQLAYMKAISLLWLGLFLSIPGSATTLDPELPLRQFNRAFTWSEGAPSDINALAQTTDGTLWIGGSTGLTRFDGVRFVSYPDSIQEPLRSTNISALAAVPNGGLWIGFRLGGVSFLKAGHVSNYAGADGFPDGTVNQFAWDRDGSLWAAARRGLAHFNGKQWEKGALDPNVVCIGVLVDRRGTLWVATSVGLLARIAGGRQFREVDRIAFDLNAGTGFLAEAPDGKIWAAGAHELIRVDEPAALRGVVRVIIRGFAGKNMAPLAFDTEGTLWVSDRALLRVPARELASKSEREVIVNPNVLSSAVVHAILEDREGNVWLGTVKGLDRFAHSNVTSGPALCEAPALAAGDAGSLWVGCYAQTGGVYQVRDGVVVSRQTTPIISAAYRDRQGTVWFGGATVLGRIDNDRVVLTPLPPQLNGADVQALVRDSSGAMWLSVVRKGVFRYLNGKWSEYGDVSALPRGPAIVEVAGDGGSLWFGYPNSRIAQLSGDRVQMFDVTRGLEVGNVLSILAVGEDIWAGGELGLAHLDQGRFVQIHNATGTPFRAISGIVKARSGDLWLNSIDGIARIPRGEIEHVVHDPTYPVRYDTFNYLDGVPGTAIQLRPQPSVIETTDGRVWFATSGGIVSVDATHLVHNTLPPPVAIQSLTAGHARFADLEREVRLPINTTNLQIDYTATSLTVPERVQFRYKLEGSDPDWQDAGTRREALYTNLRPGRYTFRVIASNNDGVWNTTGAALQFTIAPAFYQTRWFYALCGLGCVAVLVAFYRVRVRQLAAQVRSRLEARLAERERIARELHDTLLQGIQGLIWKFQAATDRIPSDQPARQLMEQSLDRADKLLEESRDRVKDLRPAAGAVEGLAEVLAAEGGHLAQDQTAKFRVSVQGARRDLHPIVREEGFLIGREALGNAFRHSGAKDIEAEVTYGETALHVRVRDDGRGIGAPVLEAGGIPGHFGLVGMRERAKKLGGHLDIWSKPEAGTEIDLRVPAHVAYRLSQAPSSGVRWLRAIREFFARQ